MKKIATILIAALICAPLATLTATAQTNDEIIDNILKIGKTDNRTMQHADFLANRIGGRPVGSHHLEDAEAWVAEQFRSWGLEVMIQEVGEMPVGFSRGPWSGRVIGGNGMQLHFVTPSYTAGTKGVQRGHVLIAPENKREFKKMKDSLKGAWALVKGTSRGKPIAARDSVAFLDEMKAAGVLGLIQAADLPMQAYYDRGCFKFTMDTLPTVCEIKIERAQYNEIAQMVRNGEDFELEFNIRNNFFKGPVKYHNVIGIIRGSEYKDEYVLAGSHLDSYDVATGAVDDGNGVSVTMEAARMLAESGAKPKRNILFCIWTGEEFGLLGSKFFVQNNTVPSESISNYFNRDGGPLAAAGITVPEAMYSDFETICEPLRNYTQDIPFTVSIREGEIQPRSHYTGGSDHTHFVLAGAPAISFNEEDVKDYKFNYRDIWHTECDNYDRLYPDYMDHSAVVTAITVYGVANLDHLLSREGLYKD